MQLSESQELLIERFLLEPNKTLSANSINHTINNIKFHLPDLPKLHVSQLLEYGIFDIVDRDQFRLSPSSLLVIKNQLISINVPIELIDKYVVKELVYKTIFLLDIKYLTPIKRVLELPITKIEPLAFLRKLPNLKTIIESFEKKEVYDFSRYNYFNKSKKWCEFVSKDLLGCYRTGNEEFYNKLIRVSDIDWHLIPENSVHPDAFVIAVKYSDILNNRFIGLEYNSHLKELKCTNYFIPSIIKRIINLNSCFDVDNMTIEKHCIIYKNIEYSFFKVLNQIFMNQIKIL
jgi:hypothetical protein